MNDKQAYLSCAAVARKLGLSRQRFWQLRKEGVFPQPQTDEETGRPFYTEEQLEVCLDLRKRKRRDERESRSVLLSPIHHRDAQCEKEEDEEQGEDQSASIDRRRLEDARSFGRYRHANRLSDCGTLSFGKRRRRSRRTCSPDFPSSSAKELVPITRAIRSIISPIQCRKCKHVVKFQSRRPQEFR